MLLFCQLQKPRLTGAVITTTHFGGECLPDIPPDWGTREPFSFPLLMPAGLTPMGVYKEGMCARITLYRAYLLTPNITNKSTI